MIKRILENRERARIQRDAQDTVYPCQEILGDLEAVKAFAAFYLNQTVNLGVIKTSMLMDYVDTQSFTPEQLQAFKLGQESIVGFFESAEADIKSHLMEKESKQRKSVG